MPITVLIAEDQRHMRAALAALVRSDDDLELVAEVTGAAWAIAECDRLRPDVAVLDVKMPGGGGPVAAREIRVCSPTTAVIALSAFDDDGARAAMTAAGAERYLIKGGAVDELLDAIHQVAGERSGGFPR